MWRWLFFPWGLILGIPVWVLFLLPAQAIGLIEQTAHGFPLCAVFRVRFPDTKIGRLWKRLWVGWSGLSLPFAFLVVVPKDLRLLPALMRHEHRHVDAQWLILGPLFPVVYGLFALIFGHKRNPLEVDARKHESPK